MSDAGLEILDGSQLAEADFTLPDSGEMTGAEVLEIADSRVSDCLHGFPLPENLKSAAFRRLNLDVADFRGQQLDQDKALSFLRRYFTAVADELRDNPIALSVLDGSTIQIFLEDEDDFAMLAENLFTQLDSKDDGKISKKEIRSALAHMGTEMGAPPLEDIPEIDDILKKHGAEGEEKLGQAQFAELLELVLQDVADTLASNPISIRKNLKIMNGTPLRKFLADENQLNNALEKMYREQNDHLGESCAETIMDYLEKYGEEFGLPPFRADQPVILTFDAVYAEVSKENSAADLEKDDFMALAKHILEKFSEQLLTNPILEELDD